MSGTYSDTVTLQVQALDTGEVPASLVARMVKYRLLRMEKKELQSRAEAKVGHVRWLGFKYNFCRLQKNLQRMFLLKVKELLPREGRTHQLVGRRVEKEVAKKRLLPRSPQNKPFHHHRRNQQS